MEREASQITVPHSPQDGQGARGGAAGFSPEELIGLLEEQGQLGFWSYDVATSRVSASAGLACISGIPISVPRTRDSMLRCIHPQDRPYQDDHIGLLATGQPVRREFRIVRPDGTIRWVALRTDVVLGDDGGPLRVVGVVVDITDRREAQRAIEFNQERRAALLRAFPAQTWVGDPSCHPLDHVAWCALTGLGPEDRGEDWFDAVNPGDRDRVRSAIQKSLAGGDLLDVDYRLRDPAGEYRWFNVRSAPVRDAQCAIREWQGVLLPIEGSAENPAEGGEDVPTLSGAQIRGARGLLDWSLAQLASASGVSVSTIKRMEDGSEGSTRASKSEAVRRALQDGGIAFRIIDGVTWISR